MKNKRLALGLRGVGGGRVCLQSFAAASVVGGLATLGLVTFNQSASASVIACNPNASSAVSGCTANGGFNFAATDGTGYYSNVTGSGASGAGLSGATVYGSFANVTGAQATAIGVGATAGQGAIAIGTQQYTGADPTTGTPIGGTPTSATGLNSIAIGTAAAATGNYGIAQGFGATAGASGMVGAGLPTGAIAIGNGANAGSILAGSSLAIGNYASATAPLATSTGDSVAIGTSTTANAVDSIAIGAQTTASAQNTIAIGNNITTNAGANSVVIGVTSTASTAATNSVVLGNGSSAAAASQTILGAGASGTTAAAGGVALGQGAVADRTGLAGAAENFSNAAVASTQGAVSVGAAGAERQIINVAGGTQPTDAVNVRQLQTVGSNLAGSLGGGAALDPNTGAYTAPTFITAAGTTANNVQAALGNETAAITSLGNGTATKLGGGVTYNAATGQLGNGFTVNGTTYTDVATAVSDVAANGGLVQRTATPGQVAVTAPGGTGTNPGAAQVVTNVAAGQVAAGSTQAVNGGQLNTVSNNVDALGTTTAAAIGGNSAYAPGTGITGTNYTLNGAAAPFTDVVAGEQALANGAAGPVQYSVPGTPGNAVNLVGTGGPVTLGNVGPGAVTATSTDAVNGSQLYTTNQNVAGLTNGTAGLVQQDPTSRAITVAAGTDGTSVGFANNAGAARTLTGVAAGNVAAGSTQAVNGGQLAGTAGSVATALGGGSMLNPDGTVSAPTYNVANGTFNNVGSALTALDNGLNNGQLGAFRSDNTAGLAAPAATGANSVAGGFGASATGAGSIVVGNGASDNGVANATILGNGAAVTAGLAGSNVALGQGTVAGRGAETGYNGYGVGTTTSIGEVAIGTPTAARTITGVAAGRLPTDAANVAQLQAVGSNLAGSLGGGATFDPTTGAYTAPAYTVGGQTYNNVGAAMAAGSALAVQYTPNATGGATNAIDLTKGGTLNPVTMTGLAAGALTATSTDAVNGSQLYATNQQLAAIAGGTAGLVQQNPTTRAITVGAGTDGTSVGFANNAGAARTLTGVAAGQIASSSTQAVNGGQLFGTAGSVAAALGGGSGVNADGTVSAPTYSVDGKSYGNVGGAITALDATGVKYDVNPVTGARGQSITLAGGDPNQPVVIHNVGAGTARTDGANFGQVQDAQAAANQYTNQQVSGVQNQLAGVNSSLANLQSNINETRQEARSAAAVGLAAASLRYDDRPGKFSVAAGGGYWRGEAAAAFGLGYTLPDGRFRLNATAATSGSNVGVGGGATYTFN